MNAVIKEVSFLVLVEESHTLLFLHVSNLTVLFKKKIPKEHCRDGTDILQNSSTDSVIDTRLITKKRRNTHNSQYLELIGFVSHKSWC